MKINKTNFSIFKTFEQIKLIFHQTKNIFTARTEQYLVLTHAMARIKDDSLAHHHMFIFRVVVKTVVDLATAFQL